MIKSFACKDTQKLFDREENRKLPPETRRKALRQLKAVHFAVTLDDLRVPPGNRLERLKGKRAGQYSIRINGQWRICFRWSDGIAYEVEIADYH